LGTGGVGLTLGALLAVAEGAPDEAGPADGAGNADAVGFAEHAGSTSRTVLNPRLNPTIRRTPPILL